MGVCPNTVTTAVVGRPFLSFWYLKNLAQIITTSLAVKFEEEGLLKFVE